MPYTSAERDLQRATDLRRLKRGKGPDAQRGLEDAAQRLERRAVQKLSKLGRRRRKPGVTTGTTVRDMVG